MSYQFSHDQRMKRIYDYITAAFIGCVCLCVGVAVVTGVVALVRFTYKAW